MARRRASRWGDPQLPRRKERTMISKIALIASALLVFPALAGCGGDDCTRASDHQAECATSMPGSTGTGMMPMMMACSGALLCQAQCINQHTCAQIQGMDPGYQGCLTACQGR